jgi:hypothetical protein
MIYFLKIWIKYDFFLFFYKANNVASIKRFLLASKKHKEKKDEDGNT